ncbi:MAG: hypothetical protein GX154_06090 [Clostridiales bacterium]|nr:hypothetical protein [Clostridiales bacterium]
MLNKKFVKIIIIILVLSMVIFPLISAFVSADDCNMIMFNFTEDDGEEILEPKIFYSKDITIIGNAPENTEITVSKHWWKPSKKRSIIFKDINGGLNSKGKWVFQSECSHSVGASGIFAIPLKINIGKYKIEVMAKNDDVTIYKEIEIEYNDKEEIDKEFRIKLFRDLNLNM